MLLLVSALELTKKKNCKMIKLIIDATKDKIFFMIINNHNYHYITHENTKKNFEKIMILMNEFLDSKNIKVKDISKLYVNKGPGSYAGIRNSLSTVQAIHFVNNIDYYCYSFKDFEEINNIKYENIPELCEKFKIKKNLINPIYIS